MATHMNVSRRGPGGKPTFIMGSNTRSLPFLAFHARLAARSARSLNTSASTPAHNSAGVIEKQFAALPPAEEETGSAGVDPERQRRTAMLLLRFASIVEKAKGKSEVAAPARGCKRGLEEREVDAVDVRSKGIKMRRNAEREALEKMEVEAAKRCKREQMFIQDLQALGLYKDYMRPSAPMFGNLCYLFSS